MTDRCRWCGVLLEIPEDRYCSERVSPQGMAGRLRRHPALTYDFHYGTGRGKRAWRSKG